MPVVLLGSGKEAGLYEEITSAAKNCLNLARKMPLTQSIQVLAAGKIIVSNDSGLMHVAAVLWLKNDAAYQPPLDCAPCLERVCPLGHTRCLNDISAERVLAALTV